MSGHTVAVPYEVYASTQGLPALGNVDIRIVWIATREASGILHNPVVTEMAIMSGIAMRVAIVHACGLTAYLV